jgi:hypothetical protein
MAQAGGREAGVIEAGVLAGSGWRAKSMTVSATDFTMALNHRWPASAVARSGLSV